MRTSGDGTSGRFTVADFAVPAVLACAQLGGSWLLADIVAGDPLTRRQWAVTAVAVLLCATALIWRRAAPVPVLAFTVAAGAAGITLIGRDDALAGGIADAVALYSVAVHRPRRTAMIGAAAAWLAQFLAYLPTRDGPADAAMSEFFGVLSYVVITALGQLRRQHRARRAALAERLAAAGRERRDAAASERRRLARDLHDVAGHHLSAVVVHSGAAARLDDPDLTGRALAAAAETGRDVLDSLTRLVEVVGADGGDGTLETLLPPLGQGLTRLGVPVSLAFEGRARRLRPQVATAAYRIVQESLTNAMRYAPGAPVAVEVCHGSGVVRLTVANRAPEGGAPVPSLGSGRGIAGMRERAEAVGGTLTAAPSPDGGWTVRAELPLSPPRRGPGWAEILDGSVVLFCGLLPPLAAFVPPDPVLRGWTIGPALPVVLALLLRAVPLWWRRRAPYLVLGALTLFDTAWALAAGPYSPALLGVMIFGVPAPMIAVYAVACHARRGRRTWPAPFLAAIPWPVAFAVAVAVDDGTRGAGPAVFGAAVGYPLTVLLLLPFWAWGKAVARRGRRWEATALETMAERTGEAVIAERTRVAIGLRGTVLDHTARLVRTAEQGLAGDPGHAARALAEVAEHARAALVDMRALLDAMER
ncbi:sensor histidine kinase [Actinomadura macrotermitis]|uniref:histidine kinase n=1 Tax=Actinomadura macrotermitis TaxID=2585200 RepID=A0A7K0C082_9ACTN|nr:histidine kinase [Actinomadura macrotermitis]MQY06839.1 hypothetical protein [Actinomadura macrotermitis]